MRSDGPKQQAQTRTFFQRVSNRANGAASNLRGRASRALMALRRMSSHATEIAPLPMVARVDEQALGRRVGAPRDVRAIAPAQLAQDERQLFRRLLDVRDVEQATSVLDIIRQMMGPEFATTDGDGLVIAYLDKVSGQWAEQDSDDSFGPALFEDAWIAERQESAAIAKSWGFPQAETESDLTRVSARLRSLGESGAVIVQMADYQLNDPARSFNGSAKPEDIQRSVMTARILAGMYFRYCETRIELKIAATEPRIAAARDFLAREIDAHLKLLRSRISATEMEIVAAKFEPVMQTLGFQSGV